jgi:hypothetical protein
MTGHTKNDTKRHHHDSAKGKEKKSGFSQWFRLMEIKKKLYELEDEIERLSKELKNKRPHK